MSSVKNVMCILILSFLINKCLAVIYHLNDTEYDRMPPLFALDDYENCLRQTDGIYCMVELDLYEGPDKTLISMIKGYSEHTVKHYNHTYIQRGVCVQKTCQRFIQNSTLRDVVVLKGVLEECFNESLWNEYGVEARMKLLNYCDKNSDVKHINVIDWVVSGIFAVILILNLLGTLYNIILKKTSHSKWNQYFLSFSVLRNWHYLITTTTTTKHSDPRIERLKGLHGYRTIAIFLMIVAHVIWIDSLGFTRNPHRFEKAYENVGYQVIFNGMMIIQIFFVQSGFLLAYNLLTRSETQTISLKMYPKILLMRWWRLTPPYAVVLAFTATWLRHLSSGPLWRLWVTDSVAADCQSYWWLHLLYAQNYVSADKFCMIQTWYLGAEMQVFAISLFFFLLTISQGRRLVLSILLVVGLVIPTLQVWIQDLDGIMIMDPEFYRKKISDRFEAHVLGHNSLSSYAIGMTTAYLLYYVQKKEIQKKKNKVLQILSWCFFPAMICLFLSGQGFYGDVPRPHLALRVAVAAGHHLIMSGLVAFAIVSLVMRFSESNCAVLEWPVWVVLSRLSYCVFLVHLNFIHALVAIRVYLTQVSFYNMIIVYLGVAFLSFIAALPLHLLVEAPANNLMKLLIRNNI